MLICTMSSLCSALARRVLFLSFRTKYISVCKRQFVLLQAFSHTLSYSGQPKLVAMLLTLLVICAALYQVVCLAGLPEETSQVFLSLLLKVKSTQVKSVSQKLPEIFKSRFSSYCFLPLVQNIEQEKQFCLYFVLIFFLIKIY